MESESFTWLSWVSAQHYLYSETTGPIKYPNPSLEKLAVLSVEIIISHAMRYGCEKKKTLRKIGIGGPLKAVTKNEAWRELPNLFLE